MQNEIEYGGRLWLSWMESERQWFVTFEPFQLVPRGKVLEGFQGSAVADTLSSAVKGCWEQYIEWCKHKPIEEVTDEN